MSNPGPKGRNLEKLEIINGCTVSGHRGEVFFLQIDKPV